MDQFSSDDLRYAEYYSALDDYTNRLWSILSSRSEREAEKFIVEFREEWIKIEKFRWKCNELYSQFDASMDAVSYDVAPRRHAPRESEVIGENAHDVLCIVLNFVYLELFGFRPRSQQASNDSEFLTDAKQTLLSFSAPEYSEQQRLLKRFSRESRRLLNHCEASLLKKIDDAKQMQSEGDIKSTEPDEPNGEPKNSGREADQAGFLGLIVCRKSKTIKREGHVGTIDFSTKKNNWSVFWSLYQSEDRGMCKDDLKSKFAGAPSSFSASITHTKSELYIIGLSISTARSGNYRLIEN